MKNPLHYQLSEYDCGPTSMLNAISYLFDREQLQPELVRNVMLYCLDCYGSDGSSGKSGTSCMAMMFLSSWLNRFGEAGHLTVRSHYLSGEDVNFGQNSSLRDALQRNGVAVVRLHFEVWHYVLLTKIEQDLVYVFDPYFCDEPFAEPEICCVNDHAMEYNRIVPVHLLEQELLTTYSMGPVATREAVLVFNTQTELTTEGTIEYII